MGDILSKLQMVSEKIGVTETAHTIEEQVDLISESLDKIPHSTNIAEALDDLSEVAQNINNEEVYVDKTITENGTYLPADDEATAYSKVVVNVGATYPFQVIRSFKINPGTSAIYTDFTIVNPIDSDGNFVVYTHDIYDQTHPGEGYLEMGGYIILSSKAKKVIVYEGEPTGEITFTPSEDFDGFYDGNTLRKMTLSGDEITPGDGKIYTLTINEMSGTPFEIKKWGNDYGVVSYE